MRWVAVALGAAIWIAAAPAPQHLRLLRSDPLGDSTVAAPTAVTLWFSGRPTLAVSSIRLTHADTVVGLGPLRALPDSALQSALLHPLPQGAYHVRWRTASRDGHAITGTFHFTVGPS